jgi:hypothetical protein
MLDGGKAKATPGTPPGGVTQTFTVGLNPTKAKAQQAQFKKIPGLLKAANIANTPQAISDFSAGKSAKSGTPSAGTPSARTPPAGTPPGTATQKFTVGLDAKKTKATQKQFKKVPGLVKATDILETSDGRPITTPPGASTPPGISTPAGTSSRQSVQPNYNALPGEPGYVNEDALPGEPGYLDPNTGLVTPYPQSSSRQSYTEVLGNPQARPGEQGYINPNASPGQPGYLDPDTGLVTSSVMGGPNGSALISSKIPDQFPREAFRVTVPLDGIEMQVGDLDGGKAQHIKNDTVWILCYENNNLERWCATEPGDSFAKSTAAAAIVEKLKLAASRGSGESLSADATVEDVNEMAMKAVAPIQLGLNDTMTRTNMASSTFALNCNIIEDPDAKRQCDTNTNRFSQLVDGVTSAEIQARQIGIRTRGGSRKKASKHRGRSAKRRHRR